MIHQYKLGDLCVVLDVCSGSVHAVDEVAYDMIAGFETQERETLVDALAEKYRDREDVTRPELEECYDQLLALKDAGKLFTEDTFAPMAGELKARTSGVIKALCLHVAHTCNLNCSYCFASQGKYHGDRALMSYEVGKQALDFLNGKYQPVIKDLKEKMQAASEAMEYEEAIKYRDLIENIKKISETQKMSDNIGEDKDIIALAIDGNETVVQVFFLRNGKLIGREHFYMTQIEEPSVDKILTSFVKQFYAGTPFIPREIMLQESIEDMELVEKWLTAKKGSRVHLRVPLKGSESCSRINVQYLLILIFRFHFFPGRDNQQIIYIELVEILLPVIDPVNIFCFRYHNRAFSNIQEGFQILQLSLHTCHYRICIYGLSKKLHRSIFFYRIRTSIFIGRNLIETATSSTHCIS